jgi:hypothetical protein
MAHKHEISDTLRSDFALLTCDHRQRFTEVVSAGFLQSGCWASFGASLCAAFLPMSVAILPADAGFVHLYFRPGQGKASPFMAARQRINMYQLV